MNTFLGQKGRRDKKAVVESKGKGTYDPDASTYTAWCNMLLRCYSPTHVAYARYGGRGIEVCEEWKPFNLSRYVGRGAHFIFTAHLPPEDQVAFDRFQREVGIKPGKHYSLDRINPNGNYEKANVRWATAQEQAVNKAIPAKKVPHPLTGKPVLAADMARELGISYQLMRARMIKAGVWHLFDDPNAPQRAKPQTLAEKAEAAAASAAEAAEGKAADTDDEDGEGEGDE